MIPLLFGVIEPSQRGAVHLIVATNLDDRSMHLIGMVTRCDMAHRIADLLNEHGLVDVEVPDTAADLERGDR